MEKINMDKWLRREIYRFFEHSSNPFYMITFTVDVTQLYNYVKANGLSFYYALIYLCTNAVNSVENFRYVIRGGEIYLLERREPSFTDLRPGEELFKIVTMPAGEGLWEFCRGAAEKSAAQRAFIEPQEESDSLIHFSCTPALRLTALTNERDFTDPSEVLSNTPKLTWGKYTERNGRKELNLSIEVNHKFIDGLHISRFSEALENSMEALG